MQDVAYIVSTMLEMGFIMYEKRYTGKNLDQIAFPLGGMGAGMFSVEGTGAFSQFSLRNQPNVNFSPCIFSAITIKGDQNISRVIEGQIPRSKISKRSDISLWGTSYGLARM